MRLGFYSHCDLHYSDVWSVNVYDSATCRCWAVSMNTGKGRWWYEVEFMNDYRYNADYKAWRDTMDQYYRRQFEHTEPDLLWTLTRGRHGKQGKLVRV